MKRDLNQALCNLEDQPLKDAADLGRVDFRGAGSHLNGDTLSYGSSMVLWMNAGETLSVTSNVAFSVLNVTAASGNHFAVHTLS